MILPQSGTGSEEKNLTAKNYIAKGIFMIVAALNGLFVMLIG